jgi:cytochrome c-type biogenesis protein CcmE
MEKKHKVILALVIVALSLWAGISAIEDFLNPIKFVSEVTADPGKYMNRNVQIAGLIIKETIQQGDAPNSYRFKLTDGNGTLNVEYSGSDPVPELRPGVGVTVIGVLVSKDTIRSNKILRKCPSKYQEKLTKTVIREQMEGINDKIQ